MLVNSAVSWQKIQDLIYGVAQVRGVVTKQKTVLLHSMMKKQQKELLEDLSMVIKSSGEDQMTVNKYK
jgi:hypothetical protein